MTHTRELILAALAALGLGVGGAALTAGPLTPPAGPVASSFKTLTDVEPRTAINATNTPGDADSIFRIAAAGSYYLTGPVSGLSGKAGIEIAANDVTIDLNGYTLFGGTGTLSGINVTGGFARIQIRSGRLIQWGGDGVTMPSGSQHVLEDISILACGGDGVNINATSRVDRCTAESNGGFGISVGIGSLVTRCRAMGNTLDGFTASQDTVFENCSARANANGFLAAAPGIEFRLCHADTNDVDGFRITSGRAQVVGCTSIGNGPAAVGAGIHVISVANCVIDGNYVASNDTGIHVEGSSGALVIRNRAGFNTTEYSISAGNCAGPIVTSATIGANTNPSANYDL